MASLRRWPLGKGLKELTMRTSGVRHPRQKAQPGQRPGGWSVPEYPRNSSSSAGAAREGTEAGQRGNGGSCGPCQAAGTWRLAPAQIRCAAKKGGRVTEGVKRAGLSLAAVHPAGDQGSGHHHLPPPSRGTRSPKPTPAEEWVHRGDAPSLSPEKQKWEVRKQQADRKLQFHHLITQHVCDFQVPIFVSSRSITGHKWFPKWAAQEDGCANPFSTATRLQGCSEHVEPEGGEERKEPAWSPRWCSHPSFAAYATVRPWDLTSLGLTLQRRLDLTQLTGMLWDTPFARDSVKP